MEISKDYLNSMTIWLKNVKGITSIELMDLIDLIPEYEEWIDDNKDKS